MRLLQSVPRFLLARRMLPKDAAGMLTFTRLLLRGLLFFAIMTATGQAAVLIVADEFPAMETLAAKLKAEEHVDSKLVWQTNLPPNLASFDPVVVYIHRDLTEAAEEAFINYTESGGKLVLLHHSISSGKRKNPHWFTFLGVALPEGDVTKGGYKWIEGITMDMVNLNP